MKNALLNKILKQDAESIKSILKAEAIEAVKTTKVDVSSALWDKQEGIEVSEDTVRAIEAASKLAKLPEVEVEEVIESTEPYYIVVEAADTGEEREIQFATGQSYTVTAEAARRIIDLVTPEEVNEAAMDPEAFAALVHAVLDTEE